MSEKTYTPTDGMASAARRALKWKEEGRRGGTTVGLARANQLVKKESLSASTVMRMHSFFSRHAVDKRAKGFNSGEEGFPSPGRVAWDLWGGDAGASWSKQKRDQIMNNRMNKSVWSGVFFPADEPEEMSLIEEDPEDAPLDSSEIVETNFEVDREDISEDTSVTNEVQQTPEIIDESTSEEESVDTGTTEVVENSDTPIDENTVIEEPEVTEE
jgi:hypothetical protein